MNQILIMHIYFPQCVKNTYDMGIIAPYREQVLLLRRQLSDLHTDVEINTVDQFQGRDKDIIIFSSSRWSNQKVRAVYITVQHENKK